MCTMSQEDDQIDTDRLSSIKSDDTSLTLDVSHEERHAIGAAVITMSAFVPLTRS